MPAQKVHVHFVGKNAKEAKQKAMKQKGPGWVFEKAKRVKSREKRYGCLEGEKLYKLTFRLAKRKGRKKRRK